MADVVEVWRDPDAPRARTRIVSVSHHGRQSSTVVKRKADAAIAADRMLARLRAQCNTIGPAGTSIDPAYDGPMCPDHRARDRS